MNSDKLFAAYSITLMAAIATVITGLMLGGMDRLPPMAFVVEHLSLSLLFRSAYHSLDGSNWILSALQWGGLIGVSEEASASGADTATA